jgi:two-component sensor histidine kinase
VSDTGVGLPADFEAKRGKSLGLQLVSDLAIQIDGRLEVGPGPGAIFGVTFTPKHSKPNPSTPTP